MRIALDRLAVLRDSSISAISVLTETPRLFVKSFRAFQNSGSSEILVACPAILTERLITGQSLGLIMSSGLTHSANCSSVTSSRASAASFNVVPSA